MDLDNMNLQTLKPIFENRSMYCFEFEKNIYRIFNKYKIFNFYDFIQKESVIFEDKDFKKIFNRNMTILYPIAAYVHNIMQVINGEIDISFEELLEFNNKSIEFQKQQKLADYGALKKRIFVPNLNTIWDVTEKLVTGNEAVNCDMLYPPQLSILYRDALDKSYEYAREEVFGEKGKAKTKNRICYIDEY